MTRIVAEVSPPNSIVLIMDDSVGVVPDLEEGPIGANSTCVAIGTLAECDGTTRIELTDEEPGEVAGSEVAFDGVILTPGRRISVRSACDDALLEIDVPTGATRLTIWTNDRSEPSAIHVWAHGGSEDPAPEGPRGRKT